MEVFVRYTVEGATYGFHATFNDDRLRHSSNIKFITSQISGSVVLLFLMGRTYKYVIEMASGGKLCIPNFMKLYTGVQNFCMGGYPQRYSYGQHDDLISVLYYSKQENQD
jgi:hypothetical protein